MRWRSGEHRRHGIEIDAAVGGERRDVDLRPGALGDELPGTMFEWCSSIDSMMRSPGLRIGAAPALRDEVDAFGRAADEHHLAGDGAPMKPATRRRAASKARVISDERRYTPRCTVA
jgi:hypothetical protein